MTDDEGKMEESKMERRKRNEEEEEEKAREAFVVAVPVRCTPYMYSYEVVVRKRSRLHCDVVLAVHFRTGQWAVPRPERPTDPFSGWSLGSLTVCESACGRAAVLQVPVWFAG
jgi:hypothetical protein